MPVDGVDRDVCLAASTVNDGKPLAIFRHGDIGRRAGQRNRFVEHPALCVAEEYGNGGTRRVAGVPNVSSAFSHPARGIGGVRPQRGREGDGENIPGPCRRWRNCRGCGPA